MRAQIPRQVGLAGSSAIIVALLKSLFRFYDVHHRLDDLELSLPQLANFVLSIETEELGISAGLQDRVAQTHQGCVYMDFAKHWFDARGYGDYHVLPVALLPPLFVAYAPEPSDSGRIHSPVKQRWLDGDATIREGMVHFGDLALQTKELLESGDNVASRLAKLMTENFATRRRLYGEASMGAVNLQLVQTAVDVGAAAKFPGSGGAAVGVVDVAGMVAHGSLPDAPHLTAAQRVEEASRVLRRAYEARGFVYAAVVPLQG